MTNTKNTPTVSKRRVQTKGIQFELLEAGEGRPGEDPVLLLHGFCLLYTSPSPRD